MTEITIKFSTSPVEQVRRLDSGQIALAGLLLCLGGISILISAYNEMERLIFLNALVAIMGLILCRSLQVKLEDPKLAILGYFWIIKLAMTHFLIHVGWIPDLIPFERDYIIGYDPMRYYYQAKALIENNWIPELGSNYQGILYYYAGIFYMFGHNPFGPALINSFVTLCGILFLIKVGYEIREKVGPRDWTLSFVLLFPEIIWFDVLTSRETFSAVFILVAMIASGRYIGKTVEVSLVKTVLTVCLSILIIAIVRTSMVIPTVISMVVMAIMLRSSGSSKTLPKVVLLCLALVLLFAGPTLQTLTGGYELDYLKLLGQVVSFQENAAMHQEWSDQSIGLLLAPESAWQGMIFTLPRMVLYLIAPLPKIIPTVSDFFQGSMSAWQWLMVASSSLINIGMVPYVLSGLIHAFKNRYRNAGPLIFHISYWVTFIAVAGGNIIIHERYRLMCTILLAGCAWLGFISGSKALISKVTALWYGSLALGIIFYFGYKLI